MRPASVGFTPAIGSSSMMSLGSVMSARPSSSSFFWPPERAEAGALSSGARLSRAATSNARSRSSRSRRATSGGRATARHSVSPGWRSPYSMRFSSTDSRGKPRAIWNVRTRPRAVTRCGAQPVTSAPSKTTRPPSGGINPDTQLKSVVLPAPLGPISPVIVPPFTARSTPSSAVTP